jgi:uncharacterized iron-regulated membrane protein
MMLGLNELLWLAACAAGVFVAWPFFDLWRENRRLRQVLRQRERSNLRAAEQRAIRRMLITRRLQ